MGADLSLCTSSVKGIGVSAYAYAYAPGGPESRGRGEGRDEVRGRGEANTPCFTLSWSVLVCPVLSCAGSEGERHRGNGSEEEGDVEGWVWTAYIRRRAKSGEGRCGVEGM